MTLPCCTRRPVLRVPRHAGCATGPRPRRGRCAQSGAGPRPTRPCRALSPNPRPPARLAGRELCRGGSSVERASRWERGAGGRGPARASACGGHRPLVLWPAVRRPLGRTVGSLPGVQAACGSKWRPPGPEDAPRRCVARGVVAPRTLPEPAGAAPPSRGSLCAGGSSRRGPGAPQGCRGRAARKPVDPSPGPWTGLAGALPGDAAPVGS